MIIRSIATDHKNTHFKHPKTAIKTYSQRVGLSMESNK